MSDPTAQTPTGFSFTGLITALGNIGRTLAGIQTAIQNSFVNLSANNVFTGITSFLSGLLFKVRVVTAAGAVTVTTTDFIVVVNKSVGAATAVNLPAGSVGMAYVIKDGKGDAGANNITITPASGTIDGAGTLVINSNFGVARIVHNGTQWNVV